MYTSSFVYLITNFTSQKKKGYATATGALFNTSTSEFVLLSDQFLADKDGCDPIVKDVKGKIVLMSRGGCMFLKRS